MAQHQSDGKLVTALILIFVFDIFWMFERTL